MQKKNRKTFTVNYLSVIINDKHLMLKNREGRKVPPSLSERNTFSEPKSSSVLNFLLIHRKISRERYTVISLKVISCDSSSRMIKFMQIKIVVFHVKLKCLKIKQRLDSLDLWT